MQRVSHRHKEKKIKLEFFETDETGENVITVIDGKRLILKTTKTIADILKMDCPGCQTLEGKIFHEEIKLSDPNRVQMGLESDYPKPDNNDLQRQDKVKVVGYIAGLKDASGQELAPRPGVVPGGIYRVEKINQTIITIPDPEHEGESKMEKIINSIEAINDAAERPELITLLPGEYVLFKRRGAPPAKTSVRPKEMEVIANGMKKDEPPAAS